MNQPQHSTKLWHLTAYRWALTTISWCRCSGITWSLVSSNTTTAATRTIVARSDGSKNKGTHSTGVLHTFHISGGGLRVCMKSCKFKLGGFILFPYLNPHNKPLAPLVQGFIQRGRSPPRNNWINDPICSFCASHTYVCRKGHIPLLDYIPWVCPTVLPQQRYTVDYRSIWYQTTRECDIIAQLVKGH